MTSMYAYKLLIILLSLAFVLTHMISQSLTTHLIAYIIMINLLRVLQVPDYLALLVPCLVIIVYDFKTMESFQNKKKSSGKKGEKKKLLKKEKNTEVSEQGEDDEDDEDDDEDVNKDGMGEKGERGDGDEVGEEGEEGEDLEELDGAEVPSIDIGKTFRNAYANLDPDMIQNMTKDTKELVKTQTNLISTLQNLEPVVKQGISLLDKFQGSGNTAKMFKDMAKKADVSKLLIGKKGN